MVLLTALCIAGITACISGCEDIVETHSYDNQVVSEKYLAKEATCTEAARYYYSCECGEKGTETFEYGDPLGHTFTQYVSDGNATCTQDGTKTAKCDRCDEKNTVVDEGSMLSHEYINEECVGCGRIKLSEGLKYTLRNGLNGNFYELSGIGTCTANKILIPEKYFMCYRKFCVL